MIGQRTEVQHKLVARAGEVLAGNPFSREGMILVCDIPKLAMVRCARM